MIKIVFAGTYPQGTLAAFQQALPADRFSFLEVHTQEALDALGQADAVVLRLLKMPEHTLSHIQGLRLILRWGAGFDSVDIQAAGSRGIAVCNTPGANAKAVAEMTLLLMLAVGRSLYQHHDALRSGQWSKTTFMERSHTLYQKKVGIIGVGNVGRTVADYVRCLGAQVQYYDQYQLPPEEEQRRCMAYRPLEQLLTESDVVTLHLPLTNSTKHLLNAARLSAMKPGAILINAARGGLVDDHALLRAIQAGHLAGAGLDCVEEEPLPAGHPLLCDPRIIVTPHVAGGTADLGMFMIPMIAENLQALDRGAPLRYVVNQKELSAACIHVG